MRRFAAGTIVAASIFVVVSSSSAIQWPWQSGTPKPTAAAPAPAPAPQVRGPVQSGGSSPDDVARFLAGMPLPKVSPLAPLTNDPAWQEHAANFEKAFAKLNIRRLAKVRSWEAQYFPESHEKIPVAYYMFSGPDFLYVDRFFPKADVYILCGKEALGPPPDPLRIGDHLGAALHNLEEAMDSSLRFSFFITKDMKVSLDSQELKGILPIFYVFLARANKSIKDVTYGSLNEGGSFQQSRPGSGETPGVRIDSIDNHSRQK